MDREVFDRRRLLAELVEDFAGRAAEHDRDASFPFENFDRLRRADLLGLVVPRKLGGAGEGLASAVDVVGTIAQGEASTALVLAMQYLQHGAIVRSRTWPAYLKEQLTRGAVAGTAFVNALRVEPELGTPARGGLPATEVTAIGGGWSISGRKIYSTGAPILSWYLVWARTAEDPAQVGYWLVPADAPGISIEESWDHFGMRATGSHDVVFEGVVVPHDHAVDIRPPAAWTPDSLQIVWNALLVSAVYDGVARAAASWLRRYLAERRPANLGAALSSLPRFQSAVGQIEGLLGTNHRLLAGAAADADAGRPPTAEEAGLIKRSVTGNAVSAVEIALSLTGNPGLSRKHPLERHYRDVLCGRVHTPQDDSVLLAAGRAALGL